MKIREFADMVRGALERFPKAEQYGTREYDTAMCALGEAGLRYRPTWQLVDAILKVRRTSDEQGFQHAVTEAYRGYFGSEFSGPIEDAIAA